MGRLNYSGVKNLRLGVSAYYNKTAKNSSKPDKTAKIDAPVTIITGDLQYKSRNLIVRANAVWGNLGESIELNTINRNLSGASGFSRTPVAKNAVSYAAEAGYNIGSFFGSDAPRIFPFFRYEYYNPQEKTEKGMLADKRFQTDVYTAGINWFALPNLVVKADYSHRTIGKGSYNSENIASIGIAYTAWFFKK